MSEMKEQGSGIWPCVLVVYMGKSQAVILWLTDFGWMPGAHQATLSITSLPQLDRCEKIYDERLMS